jgi:glycosyltransferase involved in cell wall biosynthesis
MSEIRGMIRVLHVVSRLARGGAETFVADLVRHFAASPHLSHSVCSVLDDGDREFDQEIRRFTEGVVCLGGRRETWPRRLRAAVQASRPDVVVFHLNLYSAFFSLGLAGLGTPQLFLLHSDDSPYFGDPRKRWFFRACAAWLNRTRYPILACAGAVRDAVARQFWLNPGRVEVLYLGVDTDEFQFSGQDRDSARHEVSADGAEVLFGSVANLTPKKNHALMVKAFAREFGAERQRLVVIGDGPLRSDIEAQASGCNLRDRVSFLGVRNDVRRLLSAFDLFVMTSYAEGLPLALLEALAVGVPVVAPRVGGIPEVLGNGSASSCGRLFDRGDVASLCRAWRETLGFAGRHETRGACRRRALQFDRRRAFRRYEELIRSAAASAPPRPPPRPKIPRRLAQ